MNERCLKVALAFGLCVLVWAARASALAPPGEKCRISVGAGNVKVVGEKRWLCLTATDIKGSYTLPYIQSSRTCVVQVEILDESVKSVRLALSGGPKRVEPKDVTRDKPTAEFAELAPGEYTLVAAGLAASGSIAWQHKVERLGIGLVVAALGDSITEGYWGREFKVEGDLDWTRFPAEAVSRDLRNFPQYAPTRSASVGQSCCFQSWMTDLNDNLTQALRQPVFIANEGWGGYTTAQYLALMQTDKLWQARMQLLRPQVWLIHLGVNDERAKVPAETVARQLEEIVNRLVKDHAAEPRHIFVARPCYDYAPGAEAILAAYIVEIDKLVARRELSAGADFFAAFRRDKEKWYGADPVHPNVEGMRYMARLWQERVAATLAEKQSTRKP